ncbi:MAG: hypothetical protein LUD72_06745, partial [Bacteroidales bacterium]|nr:hypothetical protein [Bacteroidales bacterium]
SVDYISYTVTNDDGETEEVRVKGTKINDISGTLDGLMSDLTLDVFLGDTEAEDNALMVYLTYSLTGVTYDEATEVWTAVYHYTYTDGDTGTEMKGTINVILETKEADGVVYITGIVPADDDEAEKLEGRIRGTTIDGISDQIDGLMNDVPIKDIVEFGDDDGNIILNALGDATINTLGQAIDDITVQSLFVDDVYQSTVTLFAEYDSADEGSLSYVYGSVDFDYGSYTFYYRTKTYVYGGECACCESGACTCECDCGCECDGGCEEECTCECECKVTGYYYVYSELKYTDEKGETSISSASDLLAAIEAYNESHEDEPIFAVYIYTTNLRQAVATDGTGYYGDEYYQVCGGEYVTDGSGNYVVNDYIGFNENYIYYTMNENGELVLYDGGSEKGKVTADEFGKLTEGGIALYTYGEVGGVWKFMLCDRTEDGDYYETLCSINDMGNLMTTTANNLSSATLNEFREIGILTSDDKTLGTEVTVGGETKTLGDLTLDEMLTLMSEILSGTYTLPT